MKIKLIESKWRGDITSIMREILGNFVKSASIGLVDNEYGDKAENRKSASREAEYIEKQYAKYHKLEIPSETSDVEIVFDNKKIVKFRVSEWGDIGNVVHKAK